MQDADKTWRDILPCNYLSKDHFDGDETMDLTIDYAAEETIEDPATSRKKLMPVIHFKEKGVLPLGCNVTNSRMISQLAGSKKLSKWGGTRVTVYVDWNVKFGGAKKGGVRVKPCTTPAPSSMHVNCSDCGNEIQGKGAVPTETIINGTKDTYGTPLCWECASKRKANKNGTEPK